MSVVAESLLKFFRGTYRSGVTGGGFHPFTPRLVKATNAAQTLSPRWPLQMNSPEWAWPCSRVAEAVGEYFCSKPGNPCETC